MGSLGHKGKNFWAWRYLNRNCQTEQKKQSRLDFCSFRFSISLPLTLSNPQEVGLPSRGFIAFSSKASNEASLFLHLRLDNFSEYLLNSNSISKHQVHIGGSYSFSGSAQLGLFLFIAPEKLHEMSTFRLLLQNKIFLSAPLN